MDRSCLLTLVALTALLTAACTVQPLSPTAAPGEPSMPASSSKPAWQQDWEKTLAAAKNEGTVAVITSFGSDVRDNVARSFKEKHGLDTEFVVGRVAEIYVKVQNERRAGLYLEDAYLTGMTSLIQFRDLGFLEPLKPALVLPEVLDPKAWMNGQPRFVDKEGLILAYLAAASSPLYINTDFVKPDEMKSYRDLLNPRWKGKIVVMDPTTGGMGSTFFYILWEIMGPDFTRELAKQDLAIIQDGRQQVEWLARGKYLISGNMLADMYTDFLQAGAPIKIILPKEGTAVTGSIGGLSLFNKAPHPNVARVFINWLLSKEGQTLMSQLTKTSSSRLDVSQEWVDPSKMIQPGTKYIDGDSEEALKKKQEMQAISRDVWNIKR